MTVQAIQGNERTHNALKILGQGALIGAASGYAGKYLLPLTPEESNSDEYTKVMKKIHDQKSEFSVRTQKIIDAMSKKKFKSNAEDEFIRMFDGMKEGEHMKPSRIRNAIKTLETKNSMDVADFRNICKETSKIAEQTAKQCASTYKLMTKHIRPTGFFITTGAVLGAVISLIGDAMKTKVEN